MIIYNSLDEYKKSSTPRLVNIGNYDGVHAGHQQLITYLQKEAKDQDLKLCLYTFNPHPRVFFEKIDNFLLTDQGQKILLLKDLGVDELFILDFENVSKLTGDNFLKKYVSSFTNIKSLYLGYDFRYGKDKKGDFISANNYLKDDPILLRKAPAFNVGEEVVSSSLVRDALIMGEIERVNILLNRAFSIRGTIVTGKGKGKQIGIPTANLGTDPLYLVPQKGVYCTRMKIDGTIYNGVTNIGINPTFGKLHKSSIETHLFNFHGDIYGSSVELSFHKYLRAEKKFSNVESLVTQIKADMQTARDFWKEE